MSRRAIAVLAMALALAVAGLLAVEGAGRLAMRVLHGVPHKSYGRWRADPVLGARMAENVYDHRWQTNDLGFRGDEDVIAPKPPGAWRIIAYGGSTTLCWNLDTPDTWPARLEAILRERTGNRAHQVLNAGDILWSIGHVHARAREEIPALRPDFVILYTDLNEVSNAVMLGQEGIAIGDSVAAGRYGIFTRRLPQSSWLARHSFAFRLLQKVLLRPTAKLFRRGEAERWARLLLTPLDTAHPAIPPDPAILENYLRVLRSMIELCRTNGAVPIFVIEAYGQRTVGLAHFASYSREGGRLARELGVPVVDAQILVDGWAGDPMELFYDSGVHYSARGADALAGLIFDSVLAPALAVKAGGGH